MSTERPTLSVVVPVFNQAASIVSNLGVIRERVEAGLAEGESLEIVVVSDGSIDATESELVAGGAGRFRVFHYDRNLGKGYAVRLGALEARGRWIGFVDADLDLDPAGLATYVHTAEAEGLDFAIGSKRHPESLVHYPPARVVASWLFQQFVRFLFRLRVRDTQVGLKVFRRDVAEQVLPLLLVKRYAFDIELLAVSRAFGFSRIRELPIQLDYRFTGSGVRSRAVLRALIDTLAIFYRLRILRYYQRRRAIAGAFGWTRPREYRPLVSVLLPPTARFRDYEYPHVEVLPLGDGDWATVRATAARAAGEVVAVVQPGGHAAGNLLSATVPYLARPEIGAVVFPRLAPLEGTALVRAAAAVDESRMGAGLGYFRYTPGNVRYVDDFPASSVVVRRDLFLDNAAAGGADELVAMLAARGASVLYTPDTVVVVAPPPLFRPHLAAVLERGHTLGRSLRLHRHRRWRLSGLITIAVGAVATALVAAALGGEWVDVVAGLAIVYALGAAVAACAAAIRHQSVVVGVLVACAIPPTHVAFAAGAFRGLTRS